MRKTRKWIIALISLGFINPGWAAQNTILGIDLGLNSIQMQNALTVAVSIAKSAEPTDFIGLIGADDIVRHVIEPSSPHEFINKLKKVEPQLAFSSKSNFAISLERSMAMAMDTTGNKRIIFIGNSAINTGDQESDNRFTRWGSSIIIPDLALENIQLILVLTDAINSTDIIADSTNASPLNETYQLPGNEQSVGTLIQQLTSGGASVATTAPTATISRDPLVITNLQTDLSGTNGVNTQTIPVADITTAQVSQTTPIEQPSLNEQATKTATTTIEPPPEKAVVAITKKVQDSDNSNYHEPTQSTATIKLPKNSPQKNQIDTATQLNEIITPTDSDTTGQDKQLTTVTPQQTNAPAGNDTTANTTIENTQIDSTQQVNTIEPNDVISININEQVSSDTDSSLIGNRNNIIIAILLLVTTGAALAAIFRNRLHNKRTQKGNSSNRKHSELRSTAVDWNGDKVTDLDDFNETTVKNIATPNAPNTPTNSYHHINATNHVPSTSSSKAIEKDDETVLFNPQNKTNTQTEAHAPEISPQEIDMFDDFPTNIFDGTEFSTVEEDEFEAFERSINAKKTKKPVS